ncbi:MAG TPA: hypothetical protein DDZ51_28885 [Planctomycetaceae bacterium]|nr:hypothetical protein [Planctomycetaceae bacterium]
MGLMYCGRCIAAGDRALASQAPSNECSATTIRSTLHCGCKVPLPRVLDGFWTDEKNAIAAQRLQAFA